MNESKNPKRSAANDDPRKGRVLLLEAALVFLAKSVFDAGSEQSIVDLAALRSESPEVCVQAIVVSVLESVRDKTRARMSAEGWLHKAEDQGDFPLSFRELTEDSDRMVGEWFAALREDDEDPDGA